jgi:hypothetical protein
VQAGDPEFLGDHRRPSTVHASDRNRVHDQNT